MSYFEPVISSDYVTRARVFISSTVTNLRQERERAAKVVREFPFLEPCLSEHAPSDTVNSQQWSENSAKECALFILILGSDYGQEVKGLNMSFSELEYYSASYNNPNKILAFQKYTKSCDPRQQDFIYRVRHSTESRFSHKFASLTDFENNLRGAIKQWIISTIETNGRNPQFGSSNSLPEAFSWEISPRLYPAKCFGEFPCLSANLAISYTLAGGIFIFLLGMVWTALMLIEGILWGRGALREYFVLEFGGEASLYVTAVLGCLITSWLIALKQWRYYFDKYTYLSKREGIFERSIRQVSSLESTVDTLLCIVGGMCFALSLWPKYWFAGLCGYCLIVVFRCVITLMRSKWFRSSESESSPINSRMASESLKLKHKGLLVSAVLRRWCISKSILCISAGCCYIIFSNMHDPRSYIYIIIGVGILGLVIHRGLSQIRLTKD